MNPEFERIRGYLQAQGAKLSPEEIIAKVEAAMVDLRAAAGAVPASRFSERPAPEEWSGNEVMAHVVDAGRHFGDQIIAILDGLDTPAARPSSMAERRTAGEWSTILTKDRAELFDRVRKSDPTARLDQLIEHGMFGLLSWRSILLFTRLHDLDHVGQLQKIAAALATRPA